MSEVLDGVGEVLILINPIVVGACFGASFSSGAWGLSTLLIVTTTSVGTLVVATELVDVFVILRR